MPDPRDLRLVEVDGQVLLTVGSRVIAGVGGGGRADAQPGGGDVAGAGVQWPAGGLEVLGLSEEYVSTLRGRARREGSAGVVPFDGVVHRRWARG